MDTDPPVPNESTPPEQVTSEPVPAVPTRDTNPVWAHTVPVAPAESTHPEHDDSAVEEALPALPMQKGDPDWSEPEAAETANGTGAPAPVKKSTPEWAQTVPTSPGEPVIDEAVAPITETPKAVASDARQSTWPPSSEKAPAPPDETDIWPPEPPTERAMPAWPPLSELDEKPAIPPAQVIPAWPDSFDSAAEAPSHEPAAPTVSSEPEPEKAPEPPAPSIPAPEPAHAASGSPFDSGEPASEPPAPPAPAPMTETPSAPAPAVAARAPEPVQPLQPGPPARPTWAPSIEPPPHQAPLTVDAPPPLQIPAWAPKVSTAAEPTTSQPGTPTWFSPKEEIRHTSQSVVQPAPEPPKPIPIPTSGGQLPVAPIPVAPTPVPPTATPVAPQPAPAQRAAPAQPGAAKPSWEVVEQNPKSGPHAKAAGPTAEDRSYAEWFAWAKRGGAPASACHAAAQGAFAALTSGKDVATAVQWATAAMSRPPAAVSYPRQTYCAWFSLANIDLNLDQHKSHAFAAGAIAALDAGADASSAHAAGLAAAGIS